MQRGSKQTNSGFCNADYADLKRIYADLGSKGEQIVHYRAGIRFKSA